MKGSLHPMMPLDPNFRDSPCPTAFCHLQTTGFCSDTALKPWKPGLTPSDLQAWRPELQGPRWRGGTQGLPKSWVLGSCSGDPRGLQRGRFRSPQRRLMVSHAALGPGTWSFPRKSGNSETWLGCRLFQLCFFDFQHRGLGQACLCPSGPYARNLEQSHSYKNHHFLLSLSLTLSLKKKKK